MSIRTEAFLYRSREGWSPRLPVECLPHRLVFVFGSGPALTEVLASGCLTRTFPDAVICGCSTAGEICGTEVFERTVALTAVDFSSTTVRATVDSLRDGDDGRDLGSRLTARLSKEGLRHVFVLSDGLNVNGSSFVAGCQENLPRSVALTGGLAADGPRFERTYVIAGGEMIERGAVAVGFYGPHLRIGYGSVGGWDPFGPERVVTKSSGNVLFELDGQSALSLYKQYLGGHAANLPSSGLLFPLAVRPEDGGNPLVRTILSVRESDESITFAGDIPNGSIARFMKANVERLVDGAADAGAVVSASLRDKSIALAILISCVGRKLVLKQRVEEELEAAREHLGEQARLTGFYSYGEIAPFKQDARCELHNQTMTVTAFIEDDA